MTLSFSGCEKIVSPPPVTSRPEAAAKFQRIVREEFNYQIVLKDLKNTVWVYAPMEKPLLEYKAKPEGPSTPSSPPQSEEKIGVRFLQVNFKDNAFNIDYDIAKVTQYPTSDPGYQNVYPDDFQQKLQNILSTIGRAYLDLEIVPGDVVYEDKEKQATHKALVDAHVSTAKAPDFFVVVFADTVRGIKMVNTTHFRDLQKALSINPALSQEEYTKRYISEILGDPKLIGDNEGKNLDYKDISMTEFLAKQIQYRLNLKYTQSSFPPGEDTVKEILKVVAEATQAYGFEGFSLVQLHDLSTDKVLAFDPSQLKAFQEE